MFALSRIALIVAASTAIVCGQQGGTASKGGSLRLEKPEPGLRSNVQILAALYRPVVRILEKDFDLNFTELTDQYEASRKDNSKLKFETVIIAYIAAEQQSSSSKTDNGKAVVQALKPAGNNLARALHRVFSLNDEQAKAAALQATDRYKQAEQEAHQSQSH